VNWAQAAILQPGDRLRMRQTIMLDEFGEMPAGTVLEFLGVHDLPDEECPWIEGIEGHSYRHVHVCVCKLPETSEVITGTVPGWWWSRLGGFYVRDIGGLAREV